MTRKILLVIPLFLLWLLYFFLTLNKRNEYLMSIGKGMKCTGSEDDSWFIKGSSTIYHFDPTKEPSREYITWKEFWKQRGY